MHNFIEKIFEKIESNLIMSAIRTGLTKLIPIAILGSGAVFLQAFSVTMLQYFPGFIWESLARLMGVIYSATFGLMALYMVLFISVSFMEKVDDSSLHMYGAPIVAIAGFILLNGGLGENFSVANLGVRASFSAIAAAIVASVLYCKLCRLLKNKNFYTEGADSSFNHAISSLIPVALLLFFFAGCSFAMNYFLGVTSLQNLFAEICNKLFGFLGNNLLSGILLVFLTCAMWMFGIHGSHVLVDVQTAFYTHGVDINMAAIAQGKEATELFTGTFFNVFVYMGGCGSLLCLLLAMLMFSKRGNNRYLAKAAAVPVLFNINEILMFGLPVVLNPYMLIPFILTPIIFVFTSGIVMSLGLVPYTIHAVEWTTPFLLSGYLATGSLGGSVLQLFNVVLGICIYRPFVIMYDKAQEKRARHKLEALIKEYQESEQNNQDIILMNLKGTMGSIAKDISVDLKRSLDKKEILLFYQPQFDEKMNCIGTEALLRWKHPLYGMIYPPLVIKLADEAGILYDLEQYIFYSVAQKIKDFEKLGVKELKFSINVTVKTLMQPSFELFLNNLMQDNALKKNVVCIEVTEQMALRFDENMEERLKRIHQMGYLLAIDDFSMGNTSLKYLQSNQFDIVKLDGNLVKTLNHSGHSREIIASIVYLSQSLGFEVLAEYVETEENRQTLEDIGCVRYQGYLYSKAISYEELCDMIK